MEDIMRLALQHADEVEIFSEEAIIEGFDTVGDRVEDIETAFPEKVCMRIIRNGRIGYAETQTVMDKEILVGQAVAAAEYGPQAVFSFPAMPESATQVPDGDQRSIDSIASSDLLHELRRAAARVHDATGAEMNGYAGKSFQRVHIVNSRGLNLSSANGCVRLGVVANYPEGSGSLGTFQVSRGLESMNDDGLASLIEQFNAGKIVCDISSGRMKALFTPTTFQVLLGRLKVATNATNIARNLSPLRDRLGSRVFHESLTVWNEPQWNGAMIPRWFDDEGVPCRRLSLVRNGVLESWFNDMTLAAKLGVAPTGTGFRLDNSQPAPECMALRVAPGEQSFAELVASMERGVIVSRVLGAHSGNAINGEFSMGLTPGLYVEEGRVCGRIANVMIAGSIHDCLNNILGIENRCTSFFGSEIPHVLVGDVSVAQKSS